MNLHEYIHNSQHAAMGCGPMNTCMLCAATKGMGDTATSTSNANAPGDEPTAFFGLSKNRILQGVGLALISVITSYLVEKHLLKKESKKVTNSTTELAVASNPHGLVKTKRDEKLWRKAKKAAKKSKGGYGLVVNIFKRMKKKK